MAAATFFRAIQIPDSEKALIQRAVGAAMIARLKGGTPSLVSFYQAQGGKSSRSVEVLAALDGPFSRINVGQVRGSIHQTASPLSEAPPEELALIERTIGAALWDKTAGGTANLAQTYRTFGGHNAGAIQGLESTQAELNRLSFTGVTLA